MKYKFPLKFKFCVFLLLICCSAQSIESSTSIIKESFETTQTLEFATSTNIPTAKVINTPIPNDNIPLAKVRISFPTILAAYDNGVLSPDGKWIIQCKKYEGNFPFSIGAIEKDNYPLELLLVENPDKIITIPYNKEEGSFFQEFLGWSPDSRSFLIYGANHGVPGPFEPIFTIFHIESDKSITRTIIKNSNIPDYWFPDGSKILIKDLDNSRLVILDRASLKKTVIPIDKIRPFDLSITMGNENNFMILNTYEKNGATSELRQYTTDFKNSKTLIPAGTFSNLEILGVSQDEERILLLSFHDKHDPSVVRVFDWKKGDVEKEIRLQDYDIEIFSGPQELNSTINYSTSISIPWTAIRVYQKSPKVQQLLLFDWNKLEFSLAGPIQALIGWVPEFKGFLVGKDNKMQVISPLP